MENKSLDDIFSELAEKYSGSTNIKKEAADIKNNFMNVNKANISSHSVGNLQSPVNITGEKLPELFTGKNIILKINKESLDIKDIDFEIDKKLFNHDYLKMQFTIASEEIDKYYGYVFTLNNVLEIELINKDGKFKKIFHTFNIENINIEESMGERAAVIIETPSATFQMNKILKFRSFQSMEITYRQIAETIMAEYPDITAYIGNEFDRNIEKIYMQYNENDWDFLVRICKDMGIPMASHLNEIVMGNEINLEVYNAQLNNAVYGRGRERENIIFRVRESTDPYNTGERVKITLANQGSRGEEGSDTRIVSKALLKIKDNYVVNDYELIEMSHEFETVNNSGGYIIEGKVMETGGVDGVATMKIDFSHGLEKSAGSKFQAYEDEYAGAYNFPYCTEYSSSNSGMFCTPEMGDVVTVYIPNNNENFSYITGAVNNPGSERFSNPNVRNYTLAGDESAGGVPMFDFQLNSRVFGISVTDNVNMNAKNSMDLGVGSGNFNVNAKGKNEIIEGETVVISQNINQTVSGETVINSVGNTTINSGGFSVVKAGTNVIING